MKTKNGHILTFSEKMQISAILRFATCDWFCPMTSHFNYITQDFMNFSMQIITNAFTQFLLLQPVTILTDKESLLIVPV